MSYCAPKLEKNLHFQFPESHLLAVAFCSQKYFISNSDFRRAEFDSAVGKMLLLHYATT